jgi:hypothetical protein
MQSHWRRIPTSSSLARILRPPNPARCIAHGATSELHDRAIAPYKPPQLTGVSLDFAIPNRRVGLDGSTSD